MTKPAEKMTFDEAMIRARAAHQQTRRRRVKNRELEVECSLCGPMPATEWDQHIVDAADTLSGFDVLAAGHIAEEIRAVAESNDVTGQAETKLKEIADGLVKAKGKPAETS